MFRGQWKHSVSLRDQMAYYDRLDIGHVDKSYTFLLSMVRKKLEQVHRDRTRDELHNSLLRRGKALASGAPADNVSSSGAARYPKGVCRTWFAKGSCSKGEK